MTGRQTSHQRPAAGAGVPPQSEEAMTRGMYWLLAARGMAHGMILGGAACALALMWTGKESWVPLLNVAVAVVLLPFIEREIRR